MTSRHADLLQPLLEARMDASSVTRVMHAAALAEELHTGQLRPDGRPYVTHVLEVAQRVLVWCPDADVDALTTALLHDAVEDQAERLAQKGSSVATAPRQRALDVVAGLFGRTVVERLELLTNPDFDSLARERFGAIAGADLAQRKAQLYMEHVAHAVHTDPWVAAIKLADFSTNAWQLDGVGDPARREKLRDKYRPVMRLFRDLLDDLEAGHPLFAVRQSLRQQLGEVWADQYAG